MYNAYTSPSAMCIIVVVVVVVVLEIGAVHRSCPLCPLPMPHLVARAFPNRVVRSFLPSFLPITRPPLDRIQPSRSTPRDLGRTYFYHLCTLYSTRSTLGVCNAMQHIASCKLVTRIKQSSEFAHGTSIRPLTPSHPTCPRVLGFLLPPVTHLLGTNAA